MPQPKPNELSAYVRRLDREVEFQVLLFGHPAFVQRADRGACCITIAREAPKGLFLLRKVPILLQILHEQVIHQRR